MNSILCIRNVYFIHKCLIKYENVKCFNSIQNCSYNPIRLSNRYFNPQEHSHVFNHCSLYNWVVLFQHSKTSSSKWDVELVSKPLKIGPSPLLVDICLVLEHGLVHEICTQLTVGTNLPDSQLISPKFKVKHFR